MTTGTYFGDITEMGKWGTPPETPLRMSPEMLGITDEEFAARFGGTPESMQAHINRLPPPEKQQFVDQYGGTPISQQEFLLSASPSVRQEYLGRQSAQQQENIDNYGGERIPFDPAQRTAVRQSPASTQRGNGNAPAPSGWDKFWKDEDKVDLFSQSLLGAGIGLLEAGAPSYDSVSGGQAAARGLRGGLQGYNQGLAMQDARSNRALRQLQENRAQQSHQMQMARGDRETALYDMQQKSYQNYGGMVDNLTNLSLKQRAGLKSLPPHVGMQIIQKQLGQAFTPKSSVVRQGNLILNQGPYGGQTYAGRIPEPKPVDLRPIAMGSSSSGMYAQPQPDGTYVVKSLKNVQGAGPGTGQIPYGDIAGKTETERARLALRTENPNSLNYATAWDILSQPSSGITGTSVYHPERDGFPMPTYQSPYSGGTPTAQMPTQQSGQMPPGVAGDGRTVTARTDTGPTTSYSTIKLKPPPVTEVRGLRDAERILKESREALHLLRTSKGAQDAVGPLDDWKGDWVHNKQGKELRAKVANIGSLLLLERSGAAVTESEFQRARPFVPQTGNLQESLVSKLKRIESVMADAVKNIRGHYSRENNYLPFPTETSAEIPIKGILEKYGED